MDLKNTWIHYRAFSSGRNPGKAKNNLKSFYCSQLVHACGEDITITSKWVGNLGGACNNGKTPGLGYSPVKSAWSAFKKRHALDIFSKTFNFYGFCKSAGTCKINIPQKWLFSTLITITIIIIVLIYPHWPSIKIISLCVLRPLHQRSTPLSPLCKLPRKFFYDMSMTWISFSFSPDFTPWQYKKEGVSIPNLLRFPLPWDQGWVITSAHSLNGSWLGLG